MDKLSVTELNVSGKRVLLRVDFNVPLEGNNVVDDTRIRAALPTIRLLVDRDARIVVMSHLGRPDGRKNEALSLRPVSICLSGLLGLPVGFMADCIGQDVEAAVRRLKDRDLLLLENLRFYPGETANETEFSRALASLADDYVNDAFGTVHRAHASTVGVPGVLKRGAAGLLLDKELRYLSRVIHDPDHPVVAVLGGAKISDKIGVIENLLKLADVILLGGGMAFTFLKAQGCQVGRSLVEEGVLELAARLLQAGTARKAEIVLPQDVRIAPDVNAGNQSRVVSVDSIPEDWMGLDIGPKTIEEFGSRLTGARTVIWNGPMGVFETEPFDVGTFGVARAVAASRSLSVVGGGDSALAVQRAGVADQITHISTGGGACLEFLAGKSLPGVEALSLKR